jgi:Zinc dependent phospholipase C
MPTSATHITIVERVAMSSPAMQSVLGDPAALPNSPEGTKMRFAKLGSAGPDIFYAMADYGGDLQDLENFLIKTAGTFECLSKLMGDVSRYVDGLENNITFGVVGALKKTFGLVSGTINEGLLALLVGPIGANFWPVFEAARQKDLPRENWYWADYLHYIKSGDFALELIEQARSSGNDRLLAYAYGYLTHYVTDVVGHPYVNQVVEGPWRDYWQRHHLVENYIDAYIWDRWHSQNPPPPAPSTDEPLLDSLLTNANPMPGMGATLTFARLNDHVDIGTLAGFDPVDGLVEAVCMKIEQGLFDIGVAEQIDPTLPNDPDFDAWCKLMEKTIAKVYDNAVDPATAKPKRTPENLMFDVVTGAKIRPDGHPTSNDIGAAYGVFRLVLKISTEEKIQEPVPPNILTDISTAVNKLATDLQNNLNSFPPPPSINTSGSFSWASLWDAIKKIAEWVAETAVATAKTVFDFVIDTINVAGTVVSEPIKYALYLLNKALFALYNAFRDVLVHAGYAIPFSNRLSLDLGGGLSAETLWRSSGNKASNYPVEEIAEQRKKIFTSYAPFVPPSSQSQSQNPVGGIFVEHPTLSITAPYVALVGETLLPDVFIDPPKGPDDMFSINGPQLGILVNGGPQASIEILKRDFGGAIANCIVGIGFAESQSLKPFSAVRAGLFPPNTPTLPNYNLDGDRSYAWPCWDVRDAPPKPNPDVHAETPPITKTPLRPEATDNDTSTKEALADVIPVDA